MSIWENKGFDATQIFAVNLQNKQFPIGNQANFGGTDRFKLMKQGGRVWNGHLEVDISAGVVNVLNEGAYVNDLGNNLIESIRVDYASKTIHEYSGEELKFYQSLMYHPITRENNFALTLGGLPPGGAGFEAQRQANIALAIKLLIPLDWLWFTRSEDYAATPEALSAELDIIVKYRPLNQLVYGRVILGGATVNPFTTEPAITRCQLCTQIVHPPKAEKAKHLATFESRQGQIYKILDWERQPRNVINAAAGQYPIKLDNLRGDCKFLMFVIRDIGIETAFERDRTESDSTATILSGGGSVASLLPFTSFNLRSNNSLIVDETTELEARVLWRKLYLPGASRNDLVYFIPLSSMMMREHKNVVGFQNLSNLGNLVLNLTMPVHGVQRLVDIWACVHNVVQQKKGDITKVNR